MTYEDTYRVHKNIRWGTNQHFIPAHLIKLLIIILLENN